MGSIASQEVAVPPLPRPRPGRWYWLRVFLKAAFCAWFVAALLGFSWTTLAEGRAFSDALYTFLFASAVVAVLVVSYTGMFAACVTIAQRPLLREALERLSIKPGNLALVWRCWWREASPGRPLRHGLFAARGDYLYGYRFGRRRASESSVPLAAVRAFTRLPPQSFRQWLLGVGPLRILLENGRELDVLLPGAPRELPALEQALETARAIGDSDGL